MAEVIPPIVCEPEDEEGGVLLTWAGWAELVLEPVVLVLWSPDEVLEELEVWKEGVAAVVGFRWVNRELSKDCSDRYGAEMDPKIKMIHTNTNHAILLTLGFQHYKQSHYLDHSSTLEQRV